MINVFKTTQEVIAYRRTKKKPIGFVPTMGNLHLGHISLLEEALNRSDCVFFSIFVNPKQFGPNEDFDQYPRTLERDLDLLQECLNKHANKEIVVYAPSQIEEVFPKTEQCSISVDGLNKILEGQFRSTHFDGVTTVVFRLFEIISPTISYFGLKDYQQFLIIQRMVKELMLPIEIIGMPIIREKSGLALSSRNQYLSQNQKEHALILVNSLTKLSILIDKKRENIPLALTEIQKILHDSNWNYLEIRDAETLNEDISSSKKLTLLGVYQMGSTRLLDNIQTEVL